MLNNLVGIYGVSAPVSTNSYESIQTFIVGSGGQSDVTFTAIPSTYKHLQVRMLVQQNSATENNDILEFQFNGDTTANYRQHSIRGDGATVLAADNTLSAGWVDRCIPRVGSSSFGGVVMDILDYTSTNKNKTVRSLGGFDRNGGGIITLSSSLWFKTPEAITSIRLKPQSSSWTQYSSFALYGIKG
jgi:hypothetical protein